MGTQTIQCNNQGFINVFSPPTYHSNFFTCPLQLSFVVEEYMRKSKTKIKKGWKTTRSTAKRVCKKSQTSVECPGQWDTHDLAQTTAFVSYKQCLCSRLFSRGVYCLVNRNVLFEIIWVEQKSQDDKRPPHCTCEQLTVMEMRHVVEA